MFTGSRVFDNAAGIHHRNRKAQRYTGWAGVTSDGPDLAMAPDSGAATDSKRIGLNARWAQIGLTVKSGLPSFGFEVGD